MADARLTPLLAATLLSCGAHPTAEAPRGSVWAAPATGFVRPPRVCWLGDSRTDLATMEGAPATIWSMGSYVGWLRWSLGDRMRTDPSLVFGKSAMRTDHWLSVQVPGAIAARCEVAATQIGSNDVSTGQPASEVLARVREGAARLGRAGIVQIYVGVVPTDMWSPDQRRLADAINAGLRALAVAAPGRIAFADPRGAIVDPASGRVRAGLLVDGVHDGSRGGAALAAAVRPVFDAILPAAAPPPSIAADPLTRGTDWTCAARAPLRADCRAAPAAFALSGPATAAGGGGLSGRARLPAGLPAGATVAFRCRLAWTGGGGLSSVQLALALPGRRAIDGDGSDANDGQLVPGAFPETGEAFAETPPLVVPRGGADAIATIEARPAAGVAVDARVTARDCAIRFAPAAP